MNTKNRLFAVVMTGCLTLNGMDTNEQTQNQPMIIETIEYIGDNDIWYEGKLNNICNHYDHSPDFKHVALMVLYYPQSDSYSLQGSIKKVMTNSDLKNTFNKKAQEEGLVYCPKSTTFLAGKKNCNACYEYENVIKHITDPLGFAVNELKKIILK